MTLNLYFFFFFKKYTIDKVVILQKEIKIYDYEISYFIAKYVAIKDCSHNIL